MTVAQRKEALAALMAAIEREAGEYRSPESALRELAESVGADVDAAFRWVREYTRFVPYRGALRGAAGVVMDGTGNSLDRSLLLYELLRAGGREVRLAQGTLSADGAKQLLQRVALAAAPAAPPRRPEHASALELPAQLQTMMDSARSRLRQSQQQFARELSARVDDQTAALMSTLPKLATKRGAPHEADVRAVADHWWVQVRSDSRWLDLDVSAPAGKPRAVLVGAQRTVQPEHIRDLGQSAHRVRIMAVVEHWKHGKIEEAVVLDTTVFPADVIGVPLVFTNAPRTAPPNPESSGMDQLHAWLRDEKEWTPRLLVGGDTQVGVPFFTDGTPAATSSRDAFNAFAGALGGSTGDPADDARLLAQRIDYVILSPGEKPRTVRRTLFDALGPVRRSRPGNTDPGASEAMRLARGGALAGQTEILLLGGALSFEAVSSMSAQALLSSRESLEMIVGDSSQMDLNKVAATLGKVSGPSELHALALARQRVGDHFLARPNVLSIHRLLRPNERGELTLLQALDIVANDVEPFGDGPAAFKARVRQGVADTNIEALIMHFDSRGTTRHANVGDMMAQREDAWTALVPSARAGATLSGVPGDSRVRIHAALERGTVVALSHSQTTKRSASFGWWEVSPERGDTLGIGDNGWGQSATEYLEAFGTIVGGAVLWYVSLASCFGKDMSGAAVNAKPIKWFVCLGCALVTSIAFGLAAIAASVVVEVVPVFSPKAAVAISLVFALTCGAVGAWAEF